MKYLFSILFILIFPLILISQNIEELNKYKYIYIPTLNYNHPVTLKKNETIKDANGNIKYEKNKTIESSKTYTTEDDYHICSQIRQLFLSKGFIVLTDANELKPEELCLLLKCTLKNDWDNTFSLAKAFVSLTITNCKQEIVFSNTGSARRKVFGSNQDACSRAVKMALSEIEKLQYKFDPKK
ncbi:MAG: hypothetical protein WCH34_11700 [Bacteroidota bacterium]